MYSLTANEATLLINKSVICNNVNYVQCHIVEMLSRKCIRALKWFARPFINVKIVFQKTSKSCSPYCLTIVAESYNVSIFVKFTCWTSNVTRRTWTRSYPVSSVVFVIFRGRCSIKTYTEHTATVGCTTCCTVRRLEDAERALTKKKRSISRRLASVHRARSFCFPVWFYRGNAFSCVDC